MTLVAPAVDLDITSFHAGFLDGPEPDQIPLGASPDGRNSLLVRVQRPEDGGPRATLRKRLGCRLLNATEVVTERRVDGLIAFARETAPEELLRVMNGEIRRWNGIDQFAVLTGGVVFTAGAPVNSLAFKNNLIVMDGHVTLRYDGTDLKPIGTTAPVGAPGLAVGTSPGVTGTYAGYAVWYDPVMDHESSPSPVADPIVLLNQARQWTKPAGPAPAAHYTHWRVYARRNDVGESRFGRTGTIPIAQAVFSEHVSDTARLRDLGPLENENDVPPAFAFAEEHKGYLLGFPLDSSDMHASKHLDPESHHPKDRFPVGGKGDMKPVRSIRKYATECLIRKPRRTYRLVGDRVPFKIEGIESSLGGVSQQSGVEVEGWWYDWDEVKGPYRTNTTAWVPLGDYRIPKLLATVNRQALQAIECVHHKALQLVIWKVPVGGTTRCRVLLKYHYGLQRWLDPDTGFEYSALTEFTTPAGDYGVYFGDEWGRVYQLYTGERDGVPDGTLTAPITAATSSTITAAAAAWYTTGSGLAGMPVLVVSPTGLEQWCRCRSNTGTVITLDVLHGPALGPVPAAGWTVIVGGIEWYAWVSWLTGGDAMIAKAAGWFYIQAGTISAAHVLTLALRINRASAILARYSLAFETTGGVWGVSLWGDATWGETGTPHERKKRMPQSFHSAQFRFSNYHPDQPVEIGRFRLTADWLRRRQPRSA